MEQEVIGVVETRCFLPCVICDVETTPPTLQFVLISVHLIFLI